MCVVGKQIWSSCEKVNVQSGIIIYTNFEDLQSPVLYTKIQPQKRF